MRTLRAEYCSNKSETIRNFEQNENN